jgi:ABC-type Fe3+/spermidine/putrescine transport system ATPase subunit
MTGITVEGLTKTYGRITALKDVSLNVASGEYMTIIGPSGCGKTTLMKLMAGIIMPDEGDIYVDSKRVTGSGVEEREIGYVFQEIALFPHMSVLDNVSYGLLVKGVSPDNRRSQVSETLGMMALTEHRTSYPKSLSGGARQKTAVARALASGSVFLFLDEPLGALDVKVRSVLRYELRRLVKDLGFTAIHVTHDQEEALAISDKIVIMKAGRIVDAGKPEQLYMQPRTLFTAKFLGEANFIEGVVSGLSNGGWTVDVNGFSLYVEGNPGISFERNETCVAMVRPEFVGLTPQNNPGALNSLRGVVNTRMFLGDTIRYEIVAESGITLIAKFSLSQIEPEFAAGDEVFMEIPRERILMYKYPEEGLEEALSLD